MQVLTVPVAASAFLATLHNFTTAAPASTATMASDAMDMHRRTRYSILGGPRGPPRRNSSLSGRAVGLCTCCALCAAALLLATLFHAPKFQPPNLPAYCSAPTTGREGAPQDGLALWAVVLAIRHGDRSAIFEMPGANATPTWRCRPVGAEQRAAAAGVRVVSAASGAPLKRRLLPTTTGDGAACAPGQLTPTGFAQHVALGAHFGRAYAPLLAALAHNHSRSVGGSRAPPAYVRSTDYTRTQMSAAALLSSLLPPSLRPPQAAPAVMATYEDEAREMMHGAGLASSSKIAGQDGGGEKTRRGACARAGALATAQIDAFAPDAAAVAELREIFGGEAAALSPTHVADVLYAHACHALRPPCGGGGKCATPSLAQAYWNMGDRHYCDKYTGAAGGRRASELAMHPLLVEIVGRLEAAHAGTGERLALLSGHDTVVAQLIAALGVMGDSRHCKWPPYASHVAFELWRAPGAAAAATAPRVRLLFNGVAVTHLVPACASASADVHVADGGGSELCDLAAFARGVAAIVRPHASWEAACREPP